MIRINLQKKKACPQCLKHSFCRRGFVILFAVTISAILLAVALGVSNIAFREVRFSTNARDTNNAFFAADTGAECALAYDYSIAVAQNPFQNSGPSSISCAGGNVDIIGPSPKWNFVVSGLGDTGQSCAKVTVDKSDPTTTKIISKGYNLGGDANDCSSPNPNRVERQLDVNY